MSRGRRVLVVAYPLLTLTWLATTPPWGAPDEPHAFTKGVAAARGQLLGDPVDYTDTPATTFIEAWYRRLTRKVDIPDRTVPPEAIPCFAFDRHQDASCLADAPTGPFALTPEELHNTDPKVPGGVDIRVLVARLAPHGETVSYSGTYQPLAYAVPGLAGGLGPTPNKGLYLARAVNAAMTLALVAAGIAVFAEKRTHLLGVAVALTPMALFSGATFTSSGVEIAAAFAHVAGLIALARGRDQVWPIVAASGVVLAVTRSLGPFWVLLFDATFVVSVGWQRARELAARHRATLAAVGAAIVFGIAWQVLVQPSPGADRIDLATFVPRAIRGLPDQLRQQVGMLGWLDTPLPRLAYWAWALVLVAVVAMVRRGRALVAVAALATLAAAVVLPVFIAYPIESGTQGRWTLPIAMAVPLLASELAGPVKRWMVVAGTVVLAAVHLVALASAARRNAVGTDGPLMFLGESLWHPPLGWAPWIVTALAGAVALVLAGREAPA